MPIGKLHTARRAQGSARFNRRAWALREQFVTDPGRGHDGRYLLRTHPKTIDAANFGGRVIYARCDARFIVNVKARHSGRKQWKQAMPSFDVYFAWEFADERPQW